MAYYLISGNVKMLRNILIDYGAACDVSSYEYMKTYIDKCPVSTEDTKLSWIAETFLGIQRHEKFLRDIACHMSEDLSEEDQDYFMVVLFAVTFQIPPKDMQLLYKCLFNLSKPLLSTFSKFLSNNEVLTFIAHIAQSYYDNRYITEKIVGPLFEWQPYISEMAHSYAEYMKKVESRKVKQPTVPIQPNVLNRKVKDITPPPAHSFLPATPPNSVHAKSRKMLTKSVIDKKIQECHEKNRERAVNLLNTIKNNDFHATMGKSERYFKRLASIKDEIENEVAKGLPKPRQKFSIKSTLPPIKDTTASLKRINNRIQQTEHEEVEWLQKLMSCCNNSAKFEELEEFDRQETERTRLLDVERKHLLGQISREEAVLAKQKVLDDNAKKYAEFLKEKRLWNEEIETWKKKQLEKVRENYSSISMIDLNVLKAKNNLAKKRKEHVDNMKKEIQMMRTRALKVKHEELEQRVRIIREIKILHMIAKKSKAPKIVDLTETSGMGFLCEMSIAELQERLSAIKICIKEELEKKRKVIKEKNFVAKQEIEEVKHSIQNYVKERESFRQLNKKRIKSPVNIESSPTKEINNLKKILEEKRRMRLKLTN